MIPSRPDRKFHFKQIKGIFKGKYICSNPQCLQQMSQKDQNNPFKKSKVMINHLNEIVINADRNNFPTSKKKIEMNKRVIEQTDSYPNWMDWWRSEQLQKIKPQTTLTKQRPIHQKTRPKIEETKNLLNQWKEKPKLQNTRWSSSLTFVIFHYCSFPVPLQEFKEVYEKKPQIKLQLYYYFEALGQKCSKCNEETYCQPFFGSTELARIKQNFSTFIYNKIHHTDFRYSKCALKRLKGHEQRFCQACQKGECGEAQF